MINIEEYPKEQLWKILVDTVHGMVMYVNHKAYIRGTMIPEKPDISPRELAAKLDIPLGEALVIMYELEIETKGRQDDISAV